ncbi:MAG: hypothetical protein ACKV19_01680 [Verrucomicrobiales bacterium]
MRPAVRIFICLSAIGIGALVGWVIRANRSEGASSKAPSEVSSMAAAGTLDAKSAAAAATADEAASRFALSKGAERWLLLIAQAEKAKASDMPGLIRLAAGKESMTRMLGTRWAELDPRHMFDSLLRDVAKHERIDESVNLFYLLIPEWMARDAAGAIAALTNASNATGVNPLFIEQRRSDAVSIVMKNDPVRAIALMKEWGVKRHVPDLRPLEKWLAQSPEHAATLANQIEAEGTPDEVMRIIGNAWAKADPAGALAYAGKLPLAQRVAFTGSAMKDWAKQDLNAAAAFVAAQTNYAYRSHLAGSLIEAWAATDAGAAFAWSQENLKGAARVQSIGNVVTAVAEHSPDEAAAMVNGLESGGMKSVAVGALLDFHLKNYDPIRPNPAARDAALTWLTTLDDKEAARHALAVNAWKLFNTAPEAARAFLSGPHADIAPSIMYGQAASGLAKHSPESALQWAATVPAEHLSTALSYVMSAWLGSQPEAARTHVLAMPPGEPRNMALRHVATNSIHSSDPRTPDWIGKLPAADRTVVRQMIDIAQIPAARRTALLEALK